MVRGSIESVTIEESPTDAEAQRRRFAPTLQFIEALNIPSKSDDGEVLKLVVDEKSLAVRWSVQGEPPTRVLTIGAVRDAVADVHAEHI
jgi:hypothetical protein